MSDGYDPGPCICPGCYAIGGERCAGYCPDAALARKREEEAERDWEPLDDPEAWEAEP